MNLITRAHGRQYFISIFIIGSALFISFSTIIYRKYDDAQHLNDWALYNYEVVRQSRLIYFDLLDMETGVRGYLLTGRENFLEPYTHALDKFPTDIVNITKLTDENAADTEEIKRWLDDIYKFEALLVSQLKLLNTEGKGAITLDAMEDQKRLMDHLRVTLENNITLRLENLQRQIAASKVEQSNFLYILITGTMMSIGAMLVATLVILALIVRSKNAEIEANRIEERFKTVMNGVNDGLFDFNLEDHSVYFSPSYKLMLGYSEEDEMDTPESSWALMHPDDYEQAMEVFRQYRNHEIPVYSNVFRMRHKEGDWRWILSRGVGFTNSEGKMIRITGSHTDITEHKKREEQLSQMNSDLETFTYIASHDLRSPLVNLKGFTREMAHALERIMPVIKSIEPSLTPENRKIIKESLEEDIPEALNFIEKSTNRMDTLTTAVLDLSRIGKHQYRSDIIDPNAIIHKCLDTMAYEISSKNIDITSENLPTICSDALALEQIFSNLLDNAIKYLQPGKKGEIVISATEGNNDVIFSVQDNGRGIEEADRHKIFEIFRRARNTDDVRGMGMGMAFVKATLRRLGGTIWCESELNHGTTFYFRLPKITMKGSHP